MSLRRGLQLQGIRFGFGAVMAMSALAVVQPKLAYAWPANVANCTANMVLTQGNTLSFGAIVGSVGGGTVTVSTSSALVAVGVTAAGGTVSAATFTGTDPGINPNPPAGCTVRSIIVTVGTATLTGPGANMTVNAMTDSVTESGTGLWDYKTVPISVGGTLNVNGNQMAGSYSGTYTITITYQ
ncbi:MAG: DUF4402 domain-containing protein [Acidiferrobacterales bacterium]